MPNRTTKFAQIGLIGFKKNISYFWNIIKPAVGITLYKKSRV